MQCLRHWTKQTAIAECCQTWTQNWRRWNSGGEKIRALKQGHDAGMADWEVGWYEHYKINVDQPTFTGSIILALWLIPNFSANHCVPEMGKQ